MSEMNDLNSKLLLGLQITINDVPKEIPSKNVQYDLLRLSLMSQNVYNLKLLLSLGYSASIVCDSFTLIHQLLMISPTHVEHLEILVKYGADINRVDREKRTPLIMLLEFTWEVEGCWNEMLRALIRNGSKVNSGRLDLDIPLFMAIYNFMNMETIKILVEEGGADVNYMSENLHTPLTLCVKLNVDHEIVSYLIDMGANPDEFIMNRTTPYILAKDEKMKLIMEKQSPKTLSPCAKCLICCVDIVCVKCKLMAYCSECIEDYSNNKCPRCFMDTCKRVYIV